MASLSELLLRGSQEAIQSIKPEGIAQPFAQGVGLAQQAEKIKQNRAALEQKKVEMNLNKNLSFMEKYNSVMKIKDKSVRNKVLKSTIPAFRDALGLQDTFTDEMIDIMPSEEVQNKLEGLRLDLTDRVEKGEISAAQALQEWNSKVRPENIGLLDTESLAVAQKFATQEAGDIKAAQIAAQTKSEEAQRKEAARGKVKASEALATEFTKFQAAGGQAQLESNLKKLENAAKKLESGEVKTGRLAAFLPGEVGQEVLTPEVVAIRDDVRGAIQATLRQTLGAQFTEKEGQAIFNRAFNPRLSSAENARRVNQEIDKIRATINNKVKAFENAGFKTDSKGKTARKVKSAGGKTITKKQVESLKQLSDAGKNTVLEKLADINKISVEEVKSALGIE